MKAKGESKPFPAVDTVKALVVLAQAAVLELHPCGSKQNDPETLARIFFDLDPAPDVDFGAVITAAKELRTRLSACGFEPHVKTTGSKGPHVTVATKTTPPRKPSWREAKEFAKVLCKLMECDSLRLDATTLAKEKRAVGKSFSFI